VLQHHTKEFGYNEKKIKRHRMGFSVETSMMSQAPYKSIRDRTNENPYQHMEFKILLLNPMI